MMTTTKNDATLIVVDKRKRIWGPVEDVLLRLLSLGPNDNNNNNKDDGGGVNYHNGNDVVSDDGDGDSDSDESTVDWKNNGAGTRKQTKEKCRIDR